jgi:hypothetical protein
MKEIDEGPAHFLSERLDGFAAAQADIISLDSERRFVRRRTLTQGKWL